MALSPCWLGGSFPMGCLEYRNWISERLLLALARVKSGEAQGNEGYQGRRRQTARTRMPTRLAASSARRMNSRWQHACIICAWIWPSLVHVLPCQSSLGDIPIRGRLKRFSPIVGCANWAVILAIILENRWVSEDVSPQKMSLNSSLFCDNLTAR